MIFLTVGTEYPFDRLVESIDRLVASGEVSNDVFAQIGKGRYRPRHLQWTRMLSHEEFDRYVTESAAVVSHAGMGTILRCLEIGKPLLILPRMRAYGEHVNDHQVATARKFHGRDGVVVIREVADLKKGLERLAAVKPTGPRPASAELLEFLRAYLASINDDHR